VLLQNYSDTGHFHNANFLGAASKGAGFAYRGDLVLEGDFGLPANERRPPRALLFQVVLFASETQLQCVIGGSDHLAVTELFLKQYRADFAPDCRVLIFARDIPSPCIVNIEGLDVIVLPNEDTLLWNEALDVLYIEKDDLKRLSPEDRVRAVSDALSRFTPKFPRFDWAGALAQRVEKKPLVRVGAI
jgi:hypothetical protein